MAEIVADQSEAEIPNVPLDEISTTDDKSTADDKSKKGNSEKKEETPKNGDDHQLVSESSEEELGSLEKPIEILTKKRDRKSVERLSLNNADSKKVAPEDDLDYTKGKGAKLGDIPYVKYMLDKTRPEDLKSLHRLLYFKPGKNTTLKKEIRLFCGYPFDESSECHNRVLSLMERNSIPELKFISGILSLEKSGDKGKLKENLLEFLLKPIDIGKNIPGPKKNKPKKKSDDSKDIKKPSSAPAKKSKDEKPSIESDTNKSESEENTEKDSPKKKQKKSKAMSVKLPAPKKKSPTKKKEDSKRPAELNSENEDEPLFKKTKKEPSDFDIKKVVKDILKDANLEEVTMKTVCKQVYDHFPDFDLTSRKDFIKSTVKETIS